MKTYLYENGCLAGKTLTVKEFIGILSKYPDSMPVMASWESVHAYIDCESFEIESVAKWRELDREYTLVIDVGRY